MPDPAALGFDPLTIERLGYRPEGSGTFGSNCPQNRRQSLSKVVGSSDHGGSAQIACLGQIAPIAQNRTLRPFGRQRCPCPFRYEPPLGD